MKRILCVLTVKRVLKKNKPILDLHGVIHEDVENICHKFINKHWNSGNKLQIITGNSCKMKKLVIGVLRQYDIDFEQELIESASHIMVWT